MSSLRDTERMQPEELPEELQDPSAHASEHVAPHPVPRISAHKTMELDTVKVADPTLNSRNAKTMRVQRPPVLPSAGADPGAGYAYDEPSPPPTRTPWMLIGGALALLVLLGAGLLYARASKQSAANSPGDETSASAKAAEAPQPSASQAAGDQVGGDQVGGDQVGGEESPAASAAAAPAPEPALSAEQAAKPAAPPEATPKPAKPEPKANSVPAPKPSSKAPSSKTAKPWEEWM